MRHDSAQCSRFVGMALGVLLAACPCAFALNSGLDVSQYAHTAWTIRDGFTKGTIFAIAQTPDGYLWLGTEFGLYRFDGVRAVPWQPPRGQQLPSNDVRRLLASRDGTLWIGTLKGLASWKDGKLSGYPELGGQNVVSLLEDREGTVWASGAAIPPPGKLCAIRSGGTHCYGEDGSLSYGVAGLFEDSKGTLWAGGTNGLWRWKPGPPKFFAFPGEANGISALGEDTDGTLLFGWKGGIWRFVDGKAEAYSLPRGLQQVRARRLFRDRDGGLWIATSDKGLLHVHRGRTDVFAEPDGLSSNGALSLFEDREGDVWVATYDGLDRFREFAVTVYGAKQGLPVNFVSSVLADRDGSVWVGGSGLYRWRNGAFNTYDERDGKVNGAFPMALFQDAQGKIWVSTHEKPGGAGYFENEHFVYSAIRAKAIFSFAEDKAGNLWMADQDTGLFRLSRQDEVEQIPWAQLGHKDPGFALAADPSGDGLWLGFLQGGLIHYTDGQIRKSYTAADGLGGGRVYGLRFGSRGTLWAATESGLSRIRDGRFMTLTSKNGLPCDAVRWSKEDDDHFVWLDMPCGLVRIARSELDAWVSDPRRIVPTTVLDSTDGMRSLASVGGLSSIVTKSTDGRLWLRGYDGVAVVDPKHLPFNKLAPPVRIEQVLADRKTYDTSFDLTGAANRQVGLPPLIRDVEIDYTALSLVAPEKVRFRYKLEGWDEDWQEAGNRRQAFYTGLKPRKYRFHVMACNNSGVWNETGASLEFSVAPTYYQTWWFRLSCLAVFVVLLWLVYEMRLRQVAEQVRHRLLGRVEERERIARDLHDTFLQSVQGLVLKFAAVAKQIPNEEPARRAMEDALDQADNVLAEGRDRVRNLRSARIGPGELPMAFQLVAEQTGYGPGTTFKTVIEGSIRELDPMIREETYAIGREAIINALTHSGGLNVEVELGYDSRHFHVRVRDDGRGIEPGILEKGGRKDHWGMRGMRERASKIGGRVTLWSRPGTGTEVEFSIPAATAYRSRGGRSKMSWFRRSSSAESERV